MADALVLAGGPPDPAFPEAPNKAFAVLRGEPMVAYVLRALRGAGSIDRIALVGPKTVPAGVTAYADLVVPERGGLLENLAEGLSAIGTGAGVLAAAADIPLVTSSAVDAFVEAASAMDAECVYGVVRREDVLRLVPSARKTFVKMRDGTFTGGSLVFVRPDAFTRARALIERAVQARKRPWELARLFGAGTIAGLLAGTLRIADLEAQAARLTGVRARALVGPWPEIALDVDSPEMLALLGARLDAGRGTPQPSRVKRSARP